MKLKEWAPFPYLDTDWRIDFPRIVRESYAFRPAIDVVRTVDRLVLTVELPGMSPDDVDISLDGDVLTIKGEKTDDNEVSEEDRYLHERSFGAFQRRIVVPDGISADAIDASFDNGVLTVDVELPEETTSEPKKIPVGAKKTS